MDHKKLFFSMLVISALLVSVYLVVAQMAGWLGTGGVDITDPAANADIFSTGAIDLKASLLGGNNATSNVTWYISGVVLGSINGSNVTNISNVVIPPTAVEGSNFITINATNNSDVGGLSNTIDDSQPVFLVKNLVTSALTIQAPPSTAGAANITGTAYGVNVTMAPKNLTTNATWYLDGNGTNTTLTTLNGIFSLNFTWDTTAHADGRWVLILNATNSSKWSTAVYLVYRDVTIDNTAPSVTASLSDSDDIVYTRGEQTVTCTFDDGSGSGLSSYAIELDQPNGDTISQGGVQSYTFRDLDTAATGTYTARCTASDNVGLKRNVESSFSVRVRSSGPSTGGPSGGPSADYSFVGRDSVVASGREGSSKTFTFDGTTTHTIEFMAVTETTATLKISSTPQELTLSVGDSQDMDVNGDGKTDIQVTLTNIQNGRASLTLDKLAGAVDVSGPSTEEVEAAEKAAEEQKAAQEAEQAKEAAAGTTTLIVIIVIIIVVVGGYFLWKKGGKKGKGKKGHVKFSRAELRQK
ncbi:MAG: hypothetical protein ABIB47_00375 [Candidatus Woesearchaeota archaeon]